MGRKTEQKRQRELAAQREKERRRKQVESDCPISKSNFEAMVDYVSDYLVDHGHQKDFSVTKTYLDEQRLPVEATISFLIGSGIKDDWDVLVSGDAHRFFGPSSDRIVRMPLEEGDLSDLLDWVDSEIQRRECDHTHQLTRTWLTDHGHPPTRAIGALMALGGFCDCEVAMNVEVDGIYPKNNSQ